MKRNIIIEKGERSLKIIAYSVTLFFILASLLPVLWMIDSSLKDNNTIDAYPPKLLPSIPKSVNVTIDYTGLEEKDALFYEKDAMIATWYPWASNRKENIGEVIVHGVKNDQLLYKATTISANFYAGRARIVPSTLFNENMMNLKLPIIKKYKYSKFKWYENERMSDSAAEGLKNNTISTKFQEFYDSTSFVKGKVSTIQESPKWVRLFDTYLSLNKIVENKLGFFQYFINSTIVTMSSVLIQMILGGMAGYALSCLISNRKLKFLILMFFLATIMIPNISLLVPLYLTMRQLHLIDSLWAIILPHSAWGIVIYLFKGFFDQLPKELMQAARVDGASEFRTFCQLVIPMSIPVFTIVAVMTFNPVWNEFVWPLLVISTPEKFTFTVALNNLQYNSNVQQNQIMASSFIAMIPMFLVFLFAQKYIEKGIAFSGVKG